MTKIKFHENSTRSLQSASRPRSEEGHRPKRYQIKIPCCHTLCGEPSSLIVTTIRHGFRGMVQNGMREKERKNKWSCLFVSVKSIHLCGWIQYYALVKGAKHDICAILKNNRRRWQLSVGAFRSMCISTNAKQGKKRSRTRKQNANEKKNLKKKKTVLKLEKREKQSKSNSETIKYKTASLK